MKTEICQPDGPELEGLVCLIAILASAPVKTRGGGTGSSVCWGGRAVRGSEVEDWGPCSLVYGSAINSERTRSPVCVSVEGSSIVADEVSRLVAFDISPRLVNAWARAMRLASGSADFVRVKPMRMDH